MQDAERTMHQCLLQHTQHAHRYHRFDLYENPKTSKIWNKRMQAWRNLAARYDVPLPRRARRQDLRATEDFVNEPYRCLGKATMGGKVATMGSWNEKS